jgi:hypothetical protein
MLGEVERKLGRLGPEERRLREELIGVFANLVVAESSSDRLREVEAALEEFPKVGEEGLAAGSALEAARMRNIVRVLEDRVRLRDETLRSGAVEKIIGVGRERIRQMREGGRLLGIVQGERRPTLYPYWQFTEDGKVVEGLEEVVAASREVGMDPETLHFFMTEPDGRIGGATPPVELLRRGGTEEVARLLLSSGLGGF